MDNKYIGEKIREYRRKSKISQAQLAELVDLSDKHIGRIESGLYSPTVKNFLKIVNVLKINVTEFGLNVFEENTNLEYVELFNLINKANEKEISLYLKIIRLLQEN